MKKDSSRKLLITTIAIVILTLLSGFVINLLTGNKDFNEWLDYYQITMWHLIGITILISFILILLSYLQIKYSETKQEDINSDDIKSIIKTELNSFIDKYERVTGNSVEISQIEGKYNSDVYLLGYNENFVRNYKSDGITVFPTEQTYTRLNIEDENNWRKEFKVYYPTINGIESEKILRKIYSSLNYEKVFDISIKESKEIDTWLSLLDYSIKFIKRPFMVVELYIEGVGAYPWGNSQNFVINFETGERISVADVFNKSSLTRLAEVIDEFVQKDFEKVSLELRNYDEIPLIKSEEENIRQHAFLDEQKFTVENFYDFLIDEEGIAFIHHFSFPHVIKAFEPEGHYYFSYTSLKQFIKKGSEFEKFILENIVYPI